MYLYHTGLEWKFGKVGSLKVGEFVNLLYCTTCGQHYHYTGAQVRITSVIRAGWQCQKCKWCLNCRQSNQDDRYLLCDVCDGAFHAHCLRPQIATIPKNGWKCKVSFKYINKCLVINITIVIHSNYNQFAFIYNTHSFIALSEMHGLWISNARIRSILAMALQLFCLWLVLSTKKQRACLSSLFKGL